MTKTISRSSCTFLCCLTVGTTTTTNITKALFYNDFSRKKWIISINSRIEYTNTHTITFKSIIPNIISVD